jgi:aminoglycoside phosphotransferase (APT) family kinase protein
VQVPTEEPEFTPEPDQKARQRRSVRGRKRKAKPDQTRDDTDEGWGERPDDAAHERWLREQRPPHWGRD